VEEPDTPIALQAGEGERLGMSVAKAARPELHTPGGFVEYRRELEGLRSQGVEPDEAFFERHDIFDV